MRGWTVNLSISSFLAFSIFFGFALINPLLPAYTGELGGGVFQFGILFASFMLTRSFLAGPFGKLSDRIGRKWIIVTGMFFYAALAFLFTLPSHWAGLILVRVFQGTASAMVWPVGEALVVDTAPEWARTRALAIYLLVSQIGGVAGFYAGGGLFYLAHDVLGWSTLASLRFPFYFTSAIALIGSIVGIVFLRDALHHTGSLFERGGKVSRPTLSPRVRGSLAVINAQYFMEGLAASTLGVVMYFFFVENFGIDQIGWSLLLGASSTLALFVILPVGIWAEKLPKKPFIFWGTVSSRYLTLVLPSTVLLPFGAILSYAFFAIKDMGMNAAAAPTKFLLMGIVPEKIRGHILGVVNTYLGIGFVVGSLVSGLLWDILSDHRIALFSGDVSLNVLIISSVSLLGMLPSYLILRYVPEQDRRNEGA
jgi:MFS family permease